MASDAAADVADARATPSPWWYRYRVLTIGGAFFSGFFFGPIFSDIAGVRTAPLFLQAARSFGIVGERGVLVAGVVLTIASWAMRVWGGAYLRPDVVWNPNALDDRLIVEGPFRYVRNPLYAGNLFLAFAMAMYATPIGALIMIAGNAIVIAGLIRVEERILSARYGAAFETYARAVPPLMPRLSPYRGMPSADVVPSLRLGLRSELFTAAFVLGTIAFAVRFW